MFRVLIVDDEAHNREVLAEVLARIGCATEQAADGLEALRLLEESRFDLVFSDIRMPKASGIDLFKTFERSQAASGLAHGGGETAFVFMTAYGRLDEAVDLMRRGAKNFLTKPVRKKEIEQVVRELKTLKSEAEIKNVSSPPVESSSCADLLYRSKVFSDAVDQIDRVAATSASVLLLGESGTGKDLLARRLHQKSARAQSPFVAVNLAAIPQSLVEAELFGAEKGAYTGSDVTREGLFRSARNGSVFLDELGAVPMELQAKLLRVIQERKVIPVGGTREYSCDVRWIAATNEDLNAKVAQETFRADLLYRLRVVTIEVPPLRDRSDDIFLLFEAFNEKFAQKYNRQPLRLTSAAARALETHLWPGNVRELQNVVERAFAVFEKDVFDEMSLPSMIRQKQPNQAASELRVRVGSSLKEVEDRLFAETLKLCGGDKLRAAAILGVAPRTVYRWLGKTEAP